MSPTYYVHPEFGFFCLAPAARRELRIAVASILFGMVIGATIVTVGAGHAVELDRWFEQCTLEPIKLRHTPAWPRCTELPIRGR